MEEQRGRLGAVGGGGQVLAEFVTPRELGERRKEGARIGWALRRISLRLN